MAKKSKSVLTANPVPMSDMKWKAESDARTMAEAEVIKSDKKRLGAAAKEGARMGKEKMIEAKSLMNLNQKKRPTY